MGHSLVSGLPCRNNFCHWWSKNKYQSFTVLSNFVWSPKYFAEDCRPLEFWSFSFILAHFKATPVFYRTMFEARVEHVSILVSSMNAHNTGIEFLVDGVYYGNPAQLKSN